MPHVKLELRRRNSRIIQALTNCLFALMELKEHKVTWWNTMNMICGIFYPVPYAQLTLHIESMDAVVLVC